MAQGFTQRLGVRRTMHRLRIALRAPGRAGSARGLLFVVGAGRDGTNLLVDYLNSLPDVAVGGEVLNVNTYDGLPEGVSRNGVLRHIRRSLHAQAAPVRGVKLHFAQLAGRGLSLAEVAGRFADARFLILYRQSMAEQFVSRARAAASGQWLLKDGQKPRDATVRIDAQELRDYCARNRGYYEGLTAQPWFVGRAVLFSYEQLAAAPQQVFDEMIFPLLDVPAQEIHTSLRKQNTRTLADVVENYDEVGELLESDACRHEYAMPA